MGSSTVHTYKKELKGKRPLHLFKQVFPFGRIHPKNREDNVDECMIGIRQVVTVEWDLRFQICIRKYLYRFSRSAEFPCCHQATIPRVWIGERSCNTPSVRTQRIRHTPSHLLFATIIWLERKRTETHYSVSDFLSDDEQSVTTESASLGDLFRSLFRAFCFFFRHVRMFEVFFSSFFFQA